MLHLFFPYFVNSTGNDNLRYIYTPLQKNNHGDAFAGDVMQYPSFREEDQTGIDIVVRQTAALHQHLFVDKNIVGKQSRVRPQQRLQQQFGLGVVFLNFIKFFAAYRHHNPG